ncbi:NAD(P)-dependent alcohol dehydrogenase [Aestuariicella hydrocarbonica]|uniref:NAD(P)-dependent alcohol dehydrogenase n=1 Tax=Pseudomaricurvus hydrocarbonicus TaxID=1470433 RepID=A0A9E5T2L4_9GAMM|nr:NAD(P)-dependent alcohol dehydrogenase [Aestuariicella hydrocarbonica]NHO68535.1 NAD(P)-dependent alcohol dehydrogenase [Aestuariicella hydrocarbonica]
MKVFRTQTLQGIDSLQLEHMDPPGPLASGQVRVAMRAASVNYRDFMALSGQLRSPGGGLIACSDGAGEIIEVAADVQGIQVGDAVALTFNAGWLGGPWRDTTSMMTRCCPLQGVMQEEMVVHHSEVVQLPEHLSFEEGATLPCAGVTAWHALCGPAPLMPGMSVLLQGGGGVSTLALQFAKLFGARVIAISSSEDRCQKLKQLGADEVINYRKVSEWNNVVRELTDGKGVDLAVDIGGAETIDRSIASTRVGGRVAPVGLISGWPNAISSLFSSSVDITPVRVGSRDDFEMMNRAIDFHKLKPVIDRCYRFEELPEALRHLQSGRHFGKIVIHI